MRHLRRRGLLGIDEDGADPAASRCRPEHRPLGEDMVEGDYVLQLVVTDKLASGKHRTAAQSIDFEIER